MKEVIDISYQNLALGYLLLIIPIVVFYYFRTGLIKDSLIASARMTVQLLLVGLYLEVIFRYNNPYINMLWVLIMVMIATITIIRRSDLSYRIFTLPVLVSILFSLFIVDVYFLGVVIRLDYFFDARYFIPITGMLLGNSLRTNIIALNTFYPGLKKNQIRYRYYLAHGATQKEALIPFMREALKASLNPLIATISVVGLISLPGMMTGQILGGSDPGVAIKYQIMLMLTIFITTLVTVVLTITIANRFVFDGYGNLKPGIIRENGKNGLFGFLNTIFRGQKNTHR